MNLLQKNIMRHLLRNIIRKNIMRHLLKNIIRKNIMRHLLKNIMRQKGSIVMTMVMTSKWLHPIPLAHFPGRNMWLRKVAHHLRAISMYLLPVAQNGKADLLQMLLLSNKRSGMLNPQPL